MYPPVLTKADFVRRYQLHEFGNASPTWNTWREWSDDNGMRFGDLFHIRNRIAGGPTWYDVQYFVLGQAWEYACRKQPEETLYISAMAPTELTLIQGEVMRSPGGLYLYYSTVRKPMRDALRQEAHSATGIISSSLLQHYLCPNSYEWLQVLLDRYDEHVVEFSAYDCEWGTLPGYNSVFWEIRKY